MQFGDQLREWRIEKQLSIEQVAVMLGMNAATIYKWERGATVPKIGKINFINRILKTNFTRGVV